MRTIVLFLALAQVLVAGAQTAPDTYWVQFTDKVNTPYSVDAPEQFLSARAIARRAAQGDVLHGTLGVEVIRAYATRMYGPDWDRPDAGDLFAGQT